MPIQPHRTRTLRRIKVRTPRGVKTHYKKRKPKAAHCGGCKKVLHGVPRGLPHQIRRLPKTQRRPERKYGGVFCPACLKGMFKDQYLKKQAKLEVGRVCIKLSGREAGNFCVIVDKKDDNFVLVDGQVKRRRCNIDHLIFLEQKIAIKKGATTADVTKGLKKLKIEVKAKKSKKAKPRPRKNRKKKAKEEKKKEVKPKKVEKKTKKTKEKKK